VMSMREERLLDNEEPQGLRLVAESQAPYGRRPDSAPRKPF